MGKPKIVRLASFGAVVATLVGCGSAPLAETPVKLPEATKLGPDAESYVLDAQTVIVEVDVQAMASHTLKFARLHGTLDVTPANVDASNIDVVIDTDSASAKLGVVTDIAKSQFLQTGAFPMARFASRSIAGKAGTDMMLTGELELHGTKRPIRVPALLTIDRCMIDFSTSFSLNRRDYHVESTSSLDGVVGDQVELRIAAHLPRKARPKSCPAVVTKP